MLVSLLLVANADQHPVSNDTLIIDFDKKPSSETQGYFYGNGYQNYTEEDGRKVVYNYWNHSNEEEKVYFETPYRYHYGHYSSTIKLPQCDSQPNAGILSSFFLYFNNNSDTNLNCYVDNSEIDFEFLCADYGVVFLTVYSDYESNVELSHHRRAYVKEGNQSTERRNETGIFVIDDQSKIDKIENWDPSHKYYEYIIDWLPTSVSFFIKDLENNQKYSLWNLSIPSFYLPPQPAYLMVTNGHTNSWSPHPDHPQVEKPNYDPYIGVENIGFIPATKEELETSWMNDEVIYGKCDPRINITTTKSPGNKGAIVGIIVIISIIILIAIVTLLFYLKKGNMETFDPALKDHIYP